MRCQVCHRFCARTPDGWVCRNPECEQYVAPGDPEPPRDPRDLADVEGA